MQQIGRNYYNPKNPLNIPEHKYSFFFLALQVLRLKKLLFSVKAFDKP